MRNRDIKHERPPNLTCFECMQVYGRRRDLENHYCLVASRMDESQDTDFTHYRMESDFVSNLIRNQSPLQAYNSCYSEKICIPHFFPLLWATGGGRRRLPVYKDYHNPNASKMLCSILREQWEKTQENGINLDKNVKVFNHQGLSTRLSKDLTKPLNKYFLVTEHPDHFHVVLRKLPKIVQPLQLTFANEEDKVVYLQYCTEEYEFQPHSYPKKTRQENNFRSPHKADPILFRNYVGMRSKSELNKTAKQSMTA